MNANLPRQLVVSIHDVAPSTWAATNLLLQRLQKAGVPRTSLLVVPDYRGHEALPAAPELVGHLHRLQGAGHEIVLHGLTHSTTQLPGGLPGLIARYYTNREGEFQVCNADEARERLSRGLELFQRCSFTPTGFVAPAWLLSPAAEDVLAELGFLYTTRLRSIVMLQQRRNLHAPVCVYSVRAAWRRVVSQYYLRWLTARIAAEPVVRLALHPADAAWPQIVEHAMQLLQQLRHERNLVTYAELLATLNTDEKD